MKEHEAGPAAQKATRATVVKVSGFAVALVAAWAFFALHGAPDLAGVRTAVGAAGGWAPVVFVAAFAALTLVAAPRNVLTTIGAALFGMAGGIALSWVAVLLGAVVAFGVGRLLGGDTGERLTRGRLARVATVLRDHGTESVLAARLMPVVPFTAVNYGAGVLGVRLPHFVLGTALGIVPGTLAYAVIGAHGLDDPWMLAGIATALLALFVVGSAAGRRRSARREPDRRSLGPESADAAL